MNILNVLTRIYHMFGQTVFKMSEDGSLFSNGSVETLSSFVEFFLFENEFLLNEHVCRLTVWIIMIDRTSAWTPKVIHFVICILFYVSSFFNSITSLLDSFIWYRVSLTSEIKHDFSSSYLVLKENMIPRLAFASWSAHY